MNIKNNKGITLLILVITVIVLAIIAGCTVFIGVNITGTAKFENVETSLLLIRTQCKNKADLYAIGEIEEDELYGTLQEGGEYDGWYLLSGADLYDMGLEDLDAEDNYYVYYDFDNGGADDDVAYGKGIAYDGVMFYKLSEILDYTEE